MKIAMAADHAGFDLKQQLIPELRKDGHEVLDLGTHDRNPSDYPGFARAVGKAVVSGTAERGIIVCGSGVGATIAANKIKGIRAGMCHDTYSAHQGVEHDDMNILCLGSRVIGVAVALEVVRVYLGAHFSNEERHRRRLGQILEIESEQH
jgi:ribose 5-phosphate isomerase B